MVHGIYVLLICFLVHLEDSQTCQVVPSSPDQTCVGQKYVSSNYGGSYTTCYLTTEIVDGGYNEWTKWTSCYPYCTGQTTKKRSCYNPTPCNGGKTCDILGTNTVSKKCETVKPAWGEWQEWSSCSAHGYGTGTHTRSRTCENPLQGCTDDTCIGDSTETGNCRVVPPCLTEPMFSEKYLRQQSPMVIYLSAQVDIHLLTKNKCTTSTIIHTYWELFKIEEDGSETKVKDREYKVKFRFNPGENVLGLYRLYAKIGYPYISMPHWMEESMYVEIVQPPPHAFIKGGGGRTVGMGNVTFDASSVSYSLERGPGDPTGLLFRWMCLNFQTKNIYNLLKFNIDPAFVFGDQKQRLSKWYEETVKTDLIDSDAYLQKTELPSEIQALSTYKGRCYDADNIDAGKTNSSKKDPPTLSDIYGVQYLSELANNPAPLKDTSKMELDVDMKPINELDEFLRITLKDGIVPKMSSFLDKLSESSSTLTTLSAFRGLAGISEIANDTFFDNIDNWLTTVNESKAYVENLLTLLEDEIPPISTYVHRTIKYVKLIGKDKYFLMCVNGFRVSLIEYVERLVNDLKRFVSVNWNEIEKNEIYFLSWKDNLVNRSSCAYFQSHNGTASLGVSSKDVKDGVGFLVFVRVEYERSISYFIQHAQTTTNNPPLLDLECRFNCMKKTAVTALMSLKLRYTEKSPVRKIWWVLKNFELTWRTVSANDQWHSWLLSVYCWSVTSAAAFDVVEKWVEKMSGTLVSYFELEGCFEPLENDENGTTKFVIKGNVLKENSGYLVEANMEFSSGKNSTVIWIIETNMLPYGGTCGVTDDDAYWGEKRILTTGWRDEGYRTSRDDIEDSKELLVYKIAQKSSHGKYDFLYFGTEAENTIRLKPGLPEDNYIATIRVQVFDIFNDYIECEKVVGQIIPSYTVDTHSVSSYLNTSKDKVYYYMNTQDIKQVVLNAEIAGEAVKPLKLTETIFDTQPKNWLNIGKENVNGTEVLKTFDELLDEILNPDFGDVLAQQTISQEIAELTNVLTNVTDAGAASTMEYLDQIAVGFGTMVTNKHYASNVSATNAFAGSRTLIQNLENLANTARYPKYEDFISTCEDALRILNNALESILPSMSSDTPSSLDIYSIMNDISSRLQIQDTSSADLTPAEKAFIAMKIALWNELQAEIKNDIVPELVQTLLENIRTLGKTLQMLNYRKQLSVHTNNGFINSAEDSRQLFELAQNGYSTDEVEFKFDRTNITSADDQNIQVTAYEHTPFSWTEESKFITSKTVTVSVGIDDVINATMPSKFSLDNVNQSPNTTKTIQIAVPVEESKTNSRQMILYKTYWKTPSDSLIISIKKAVEYLNHSVFINNGTPPSEDTYTWKKDVSSSDFIRPGEINLVVSSLYIVPSIVYVGVLITSEEYLSEQVINPVFRIAEYEMQAATTGCRIWDDTNQEWDKDSCKLTEESSIDKTVCDCPKAAGNTFATTFYVPPNTIDFSTVFDRFDLKNNAAVFVVVVSLVCLFLLLCIWAVRQDRKDIDKWALSYLMDNAPDDDYLYIVTVYTGLQRSSGTQSNVHFMIIDGLTTKENGETHNEHAQVRVLDDGSHKGFETGSVRKFVMAVTEPFAEPSAIKIWHDNSGPGSSASWFINKIILEDVQTKAKFYFICNEWLSLDDKHASIEAAIPVSNKKERQKFSFLFGEKTRQNVTENHLWLSVVLRPEESNFVRAERLACCLAVLFLSMISNAMFYQQEAGGKIQLGPLSFTLSSIYISFISALICVPPLFVITYILKNSARRRRRKKDVYMTENRALLTTSDITLPFWARYLAWMLMFASVVVPGFFLILYSMEWGKSKSEEWLLCFFFSFFDSIVIVDPIKIIIMSVIFSWIIKSTKEKSMKYDKSLLLMECRKRTSSPLMYILDIYKKQTKAPVDSGTLANMKAKRNQQLKMQRTFVELVLYLFFLLMLYMVSYSNRDPGWFFLQRHIDQHLVTKGPIKSFRFEQIHSVQSFYTWFSDTFVPFMFPYQDENDENMPAYYRLYVKDRTNFRVGPVRLRQLRINSAPCLISFQNHTTCFPSYSYKSHHVDNHCLGWQNEPCARGHRFYNISFESWKYRPLNDNVRPSLYGQIGSYDEDGYVTEFNVNYRVSKMLLQELHTYMWIDRQTRTAIVEFTLYNVNDNAFIYCAFICEFPASGGVFTSTVYKPFRPYQHVGNLGIFVFVCELLSLVGVLIFSISKIIRFCRKKKAKDLWDALDVIIILMYLLSLTFYIGRSLVMNHAMKTFKDDRNKFVDFNEITFWDEMFNISLSILIFLTTFRILKILRYSDRINQLGRVLKYTSMELRGCFVVFFTVYSAFIISGHLLFGRYLDTYKNLFVSSTTLANAVIGKNSISDLFSIEPILGRMYYFLFVLLLLWVMLNILISTLNDGISIVRSQKIETKYGVVDFLVSFLGTNLGQFMSSKKNYEVSVTDKRTNEYKYQDITIPNIDTHREIQIDYNDKHNKRP